MEVKSMTTKGSIAAKERWKKYRLAKLGGGNSMTTNKNDRELLDWAKKHKENV